MCTKVRLIQYTDIYFLLVQDQNQSNAGWWGFLFRRAPKSFTARVSGIAHRLLKERRTLLLEILICHFKRLWLFPIHALGCFTIGRVDLFWRPVACKNSKVAHFGASSFKKQGIADGDLLDTVSFLFTSNGFDCWAQRCPAASHWLCGAGVLVLLEKEME